MEIAHLIYTYVGIRYPFYTINVVRMRFISGILLQTAIKGNCYQRSVTAQNIYGDYYSNFINVQSTVVSLTCYCLVIMPPMV